LGSCRGAGASRPPTVQPRKASLPGRLPTEKLYGDIVARGDLRRRFTPEQLKNIPIKAPEKRRLIGRDTLALDVPSKVSGQGRYGLDAVVEGMVYARPKIPPTRYGSKVVSIDDSEAKGLPGYLKSIALEDPSGTVPGWVMVLADSFIIASRAADLVKVVWSSGKAATVSEQDIQNRAAELIADRNGGSLLIDDPGVDAALASAKHKIERTYTTSTVMHFALEPVNALAFEKDGRFRNSYRQSMADAHSSGSGQGAGAQPGQDRDA
jgi:isoquinoline 1-oxidoreductase beta subunit